MPPPTTTETEAAPPRLSIVVPNYNQGAFLEAALDSVLSQGYPDLELIVIDGGSTDASLAVLEKYRAGLHFVCSERDRGHYDAVNKGFAHASGEVLGFLNSDDKYFPGALGIVGNVFGAFPGVSWLTSLLPAVWDYQGHCTEVHPHPGYSRDAFLDGEYGGGAGVPGMFIQQESTFWRRSLWEQAGSRLDEGVTAAADFELWSRFYRHADLWGISTLLGGFRKRAGQRSDDYALYAEQCRRILQQSRRDAEWRGNSARRWCRRLRLQHAPQFGPWIQGRLAYTATNILREQPGQPEAAWALRRVKFFR